MLGIPQSVVVQTVVVGACIDGLTLGFEFLEHFDLVDVFIERIRIGHEIGRHPVAKALEQPDGMEIAGMGVEPSRGETALDDA